MAHIKMFAWVDLSTNPATQRRLSTLGPTLDVFSDLNVFIDDMTQNITEADSVTLITSGPLAQDLIRTIDSFPQLRAIYIYCTDAIQHVRWAQEYNKIGNNIVFNEENDLVAQLTADLESTALDVCISLLAYSLSYHDKSSSLPYSK